MATSLRRPISALLAQPIASSSRHPPLLHRIRPFSTSRPHSAAPPPPELPDVSVKLREIMRNVAQPVAVAVARVPDSLRGDSAYHGATLTSFTSLTLHPYPLVAFSLRLPSRLADCLRPWIKPPAASLTSLPIEEGEGEHSSDPPNTSTAPPLTVSLLSLPNHPTAQLLSSRLPSQSSLFESSEWTPHDPPGLAGAMGSLQCEILHSIPLCDICGPSTLLASADACLPPPAGPQDGCGIPPGPGMAGRQGSELFICKVTEVIPGTGKEPLLYWNQQYTTAREGGGTPR